MKFVSAVLLSIAASMAQAKVDTCCWDTQCEACFEALPPDYVPGVSPELSKMDCLNAGFPSFLVLHPTLGDKVELLCMADMGPPLIDCCQGYDPTQDDPEYGPCTGCDMYRVTLEECQSAPGYTHWFEYYHEQYCHSMGAGADGDPHIKTWAGKWFDYHGECDLVMMHVNQFQDKGAFSIHARTKIRDDYSFISNAVLRIGDDLLEVGSWGDYSINGIGGGIPEARQGGYSLGTVGGLNIIHTHPDEKNHNFEIILGHGEVLTFAVFKDLVSIRFKGASNQHFQTALGLMGDFSGNKVARDGKTVMTDSNEFGQEWQVQPEEGMLFVTEPAPGKCKLPSKSATAARTRALRSSEVDKETAQKACANHKGEAFEACVVDVQLTGDVAIANAGGYN